MATVSKKLMFEMMEAEENPLPYFRIMDINRNTIAENDSDEDLDSATAKLKKALTEIEDSIVWVKLCNATKATIGRGGNKHTFWEQKVNLEKETKKETGVQASGMSDQVLKLIEKNHELQRKIERLEDQKKYEALERKIDDLKSNDILTKLLSSPQVMQGIGNLLGVQPGTMIGLAGHKDETVNLDFPAREQKIKEAITRIIKVDPKFDEHIQLIADFAESDKEQYFQTIEMLKKV